MADAPVATLPLDIGVTHTAQPTMRAHAAVRSHKGKESNDAGSAKCARTDLVMRRGGHRDSQPTSAENLSLHDLRPYFENCTIASAAASLGIGLTSFKQRCRVLGVARWPYRQLKSLDQMLEKLEQMEGQEYVQARQRAPEATTSPCTRLVLTYTVCYVLRRKL